MSFVGTGPVLEVEGLEVRYSGVPAVRGVSFAVAPGEVLGIVGPNGAGKSSLLLAVMGAVRSTGSVRFGGRPLDGLAPEDRARLGMALVPEGRHVFERLSVADNLRLGLTARRAVDPSATAYVHELFPILAQFSQRPAGLLSGGQQQMLAIGRALIAGPSVLLLDEPSLGLAPAVVDTVFETISAIRQQGTTVVIVEQRAQLTVEFADRTLVLANGELRASLSPADAADPDTVAAAYFS